jgi:HK97 family phage major capsid protein
MQLIDFVKVQNAMSQASPQTEGSDFGGNAQTFTSTSATVRTIASWIPSTKQVLDDFGELLAFLDTTLRFYVNLGEERQMLSGDGTGTNLLGLITQAAPFNTGLLKASAGWTKIDIILRAIEQLAIAKEFSPTFVVLNPTDWGDMRGLKNTLGDYILGHPQAAVPPSLFNRRVVETNNIAAGTFLVGSSDPAAVEIRDRLELTVEIGAQHSDYFTRGLVAIRAEKRLAFLTKRPNAFVSGVFTSSPA